jgi:hypothetical protein
MWATPSTTINDIVNILFKAYPIKNKTTDEIFFDPKIRSYI